MTIIRTEGKEVPDTTLEEAARFAVSYFSVWKGGLFEGDCYLVKADQVTKTPESGEFLKKILPSVGFTLST
ncbi:MAG: NFACT RNA binding domain-containing protein [Methanotrichaceae archaeon]